MCRSDFKSNSNKSRNCQNNTAIHIILSIAYMPYTYIMIFTNNDENINDDNNNGNYNDDNNKNIELNFTFIIIFNIFQYWYNMIIISVWVLKTKCLNKIGKIISIKGRGRLIMAIGTGACSVGHVCVETGNCVSYHAFCCRIRLFCVERVLWYYIYMRQKLKMSSIQT